MAKAKGTTLVGAVKALRKSKERARELLAPEHHHYLEERVSEASWYPEEDLQALLEAVIALAGHSGRAVFEQMGRYTARSHMEGVYAHLKGRGDRLSVSRRAYALWGSQHDTGHIEVSSPEPNEAVFKLKDYANPSEVMCGIMAGYFAETYRIQGASDIRIEHTRCIVRGDGECVWHLQYSR